MKKIFLTSGLVLCVACPAFAAGSGFPADAQGNVPTGQQAGACVEDYLGVTEGPTILDAIWNAKTFDVTYDAGTPQKASGTVSGTPAATTATYDAPFSVSATEPTLTGWTFNGWVADHNMSTGATEDTDYAAGASVAQYKVADDTELVAQWDQNEYTVTYACGNGTAVANATMTKTATYDDPFTGLSVGNICTAPEGNSFVSWSCVTTGENGTAVTLPADGSNWNIDSDVTCTATWSANTITITWTSDGQTVSGGSASCVYGADVTLPTAPTKTGYDFGGWAVVENEPETQTEP